MRVRFAPELYRPDEATANGTLNDAVTLVEEWLNRDDSLHIYWLLSPPDVADYDPNYVHANKDQVTLIEVEPFLSGHKYEDAFPETGYTEEQLLALQEHIFDHFGYIDVVIDQHVTGRYDLYKWLLENAHHRKPRSYLLRWWCISMISASHSRNTVTSILMTGRHSGR